MTQDTPGGPQISFGAYVKPDTVHEAPEPEAMALPFISARKQPMPPTAASKTRKDTSYLVMGLIGALTFLLGILVMQFLSRGQAVEVAMAPAVAPPVAPVAEPKPPTTDVLAAAVTASLESGVTRNAPSDLITPSGAMSRATPEALSMKDILLGLTPTRSALADTKQDLIGRDKLQMLRESVLAGKFTVKTVKRHGKERLCLRVPKGNVTQDEAADLIMQAAERGEIDLPASLSTADGSFDADTLIFNLVQTSLANDGTEEGKRAAEEMGRRAFAASAAKSKKVKDGRIYVVQPGDSLAYISLQFYGQPSNYLKIFDANRAFLKSPDQIQIGQRLKIPS